MLSTSSDLKITPVTFQLNRKAVDKYYKLQKDDLNTLKDDMKASRPDGMVALVRLHTWRGDLMVCNFVDTSKFVAQTMHNNLFVDDLAVDALAKTNDRKAAFDLLREEIAAIADERMNHTPGVAEWFTVNRQDALTAFGCLTQAS